MRVSLFDVLGISTGVQTTYLLVHGSYFDEPLAFVFALISTGGTASSSLHAAFNQRPPLTKTLKEGQRV